MLFTSTVFLFAFLPIVLTLYFAAQSLLLRNILLVSASFIFYAWGEPVFVGLLLLSILLNFGIGIWIENTKPTRSRIVILTLGIAANLLPLSIFKYGTFLVGNIDQWIGMEGRWLAAIGELHLPIGISFYTFQAISYLIDIQRGSCRAQRSPLRLALYISLFPQLIAGPIVRYRMVARQLEERPLASSEIVEGVQRFIIGLAKKVLIANALARPVDAIFALGPGELQPAVAWLGIACFVLQIYFDFSGYSDMAIGLGRIFGFRFPENFAYPYIASSMTEFWRRWHISLSTWLRDYLYISLGGNRISSRRTYLNLAITMLLGGLWHGASWNFVIWGGVHGGGLIIERWLRINWGGVELEPRSPLRATGILSRGLAHTYVLLFWTLSMVIFRCEGIDHALGYYAALAGAPASALLVQPLASYLDSEVILVILAAMLGSTPWIRESIERLQSSARTPSAIRGITSRFLAPATTAVLILLFLGCTMSLMAGIHNPFIYFQF